MNHGLLRYAATQLPAGTTLEVAELDGIPMYNSDLESPAFPESVQRLREQVAGASAILFACPEYNYGPSPVLTNAIAWASRAPNAFKGKTGAIVGAGGMMGTSKAQIMLRTMCVELDILLVTKPECCLFAWAQGGFNLANGDVIGEDQRSRVKAVLDELLSLTGRLAPRA